MVVAHLFTCPKTDVSTRFNKILGHLARGAQDLYSAKVYLSVRVSVFTHKQLMESYVQCPLRYERHLICRSRETPRAAALPSQRQPAENRGLASGIIDEDISQKRFR